MIMVKYSYLNRCNTWDRLLGCEQEYNDWLEVFSPFIILKSKRVIDTIKGYKQLIKEVMKNGL